MDERNLLPNELTDEELQEAMDNFMFEPTNYHANEKLQRHFDAIRQDVERRGNGFIYKWQDDFETKIYGGLL